VPGLLAAPFAGVVADRYDRRAVVIVSAALSGAAAAAVAVAIAVQAPIVVLLLLTAVGAVVRSPYRPAAGALTPQVVDEPALPTANAILGALENVVVVLGPAIGGVLLLLQQPAAAPALNAVGWFAAAVLGIALAVRSRGTPCPAIGRCTRWPRRGARPPRDADGGCAARVRHPRRAPGERLPGALPAHQPAPRHGDRRPRLAAGRRCCGRDRRSGGVRPAQRLSPARADHRGRHRRPGAALGRDHAHARPRDRHRAAGPVLSRALAVIGIGVTALAVALSPLLMRADRLAAARCST
jgi:hypothetical protein